MDSICECERAGTKRIVSGAALSEALSVPVFGFTPNAPRSSRKREISTDVSLMLPISVSETDDDPSRVRRYEERDVIVTLSAASRQAVSR